MAGATGIAGYRVFDNGVLESGSGAPYEPWTRWRDDPSPLGAVSAAVLAANPHNTQPWAFRVTADAVDVFAESAREMAAVDPGRREHHIGLGCATTCGSTNSHLNSHSHRLNGASSRAFTLTGLTTTGLPAMVWAPHRESPEAKDPGGGRESPATTVAVTAQDPRPTGLLRPGAGRTALPRRVRRFKHAGVDQVAERVAREAVVELRGEIAPDLAEYARRKVAGVLRHTRRTVLRVHVRIERHGDPGRDRLVSAHATVDLDGTPMRVHVTATKPGEAVDMLVERLDHRLERVSPDRERRHDRATPRDANDRPAAADEPADREIVRHTTISPQRCSVDDAVAEMDDLDLEFHLFVEADGGQEAVVYREGPTGLRLTRAGGGTDVGAHTADLTVSPHPAPVLGAREAVDRLRLTGMRFLFYVDGDHGRAAVLHHRSDGNYGLVDPENRP